MRSTYLGQFTDEVANEIAGELESRGIAWSHKQAGAFTRIFFIGEWGTRLYVDRDRLDEARRIADRVRRKREDP